MSWANTLTNIISMVINALWIIIILGIVAVIGFIIYDRMTYKYNVRIREVIKGRKIIIDDKAKDYQKEKGSFWKLMKSKDILPMPPSEAIEIDKTGRKCVEVYKTETGEYSYIVDKGDPEGFQALTTNQRLILINQIRKAHNRKKRTLMDLALPIAGIFSMVILVICLMVFYGDIAKPVLDMSDKQVAIAQQQTEAIKMLQEMIQKKQYVQDTPIQEPPD